MQNEEQDSGANGQNSGVGGGLQLRHMEHERIQTGSENQESIIGNEFDIVQEQSINTDDFQKAALENEKPAREKQRNQDQKAEHQQNIGDDQGGNSDEQQNQLSIDDNRINFQDLEDWTEGSDLSDQDIFALNQGDEAEIANFIGIHMLKSLPEVKSRSSEGHIRQSGFNVDEDLFYEVQPNEADRDKSEQQEER